MGSVHELGIEGKGNEAELAMADLARALRRAVNRRVGSEASFRERQAMTLEVADAASKQYLEETLQRNPSTNDVLKSVAVSGKP